MSKKDKKGVSLSEDLQAVMSMIPKLENLIKIQKEIEKEYQLYRKNGGNEIPGIEKYLGCQEDACDRCEKPKKTEKTAKIEDPEKTAKKKKTKKKDQ